jgi:hypothetical protein
MASNSLSAPPSRDNTNGHAIDDDPFNNSGHTNVARLQSSGYAQDDDPLNNSGMIVGVE